MEISSYVKSIKKLSSSSHKGQNGKVMVIGGSELFHAASRWALDVVSSMVDMVFYSSVPLNNELIREAKGEFWSGVIVPRTELESYLKEADVILIGPGMTRQDVINGNYERLSFEDWETDTYKITNYLLSTYASKKWVIDAGALQMVDPTLLRSQMICTPHQGELERLIERSGFTVSSDPLRRVTELSERLNDIILLNKGEVDIVAQGRKVEQIRGGNAGMTKGGTGDVLAGLVAGLYAFTNDPFSAAAIASYVNKRAGDILFEDVGPFFTTNQLVTQIPKVLKTIFYP